MRLAWPCRYAAVCFWWVSLALVSPVYCARLAAASPPTDGTSLKPSVLLENRKAVASRPLVRDKTKGRPLGQSPAQPSPATGGDSPAFAAHDQSAKLCDRFITR